MTNKFTTYSDGGARGNPGPAGIGFVVYDAQEQEIVRFKKHIGDATNNQAEYQALLEAIKQVESLGGQELVSYLDSELVVRQLSGVYKIKEPGLQPLAAEILRHTSKFKKIHFEHVPREKNKLADQLVNEALDEAGF